MAKSGPIIVIEDDLDDQEILKDVFQDLKILNIIKYFSNCKDVLDYLLTTTEKPFLIICDVNIPVMTGTELKRKINLTPYLRKKSIPFVFLTTSSSPQTIEEAFEVMADGYFVKPGRINEIRETIMLVINYWMVSRHPNT
jgi:CheY-like chemotaxis protein